MLIIYSTYNCATLTRILSTAKPVFLVVMRYKTIVISCFIRFRTNADKILRTNSFALRWFVANGCRCNAGVWVSDLGCRHLRTVGLIASRTGKTWLTNAFMRCPLQNACSMFARICVARVKCNLTIWSGESRNTMTDMSEDVRSTVSSVFAWRRSAIIGELVTFSCESRLAYTLEIFRQFQTLSCKV